ncbi:HEAT repeat domain-containing protein [Stappia sp. TSB10P1A]|uniref:HEAT repeat domain-containing protein n=1 Tax=Stappia sp. TSB10P1A TaxID=2003585 RepID=UPI001643E3A6|nr:HEAT repeat domain-containing protein [Stappia sp. TSB10P1A]
MSESLVSIVTLTAFAVGLFYLIGGVAHMRSLVLDSMAGELLTMLGDGEAGRERWRVRVLTAGAALTFASGLSLLALSRWTLPLFVANAALQGFYLVWATRAFSPQEGAEPKGRRSTVRAFILYLAALGFVVALDRLGLWHVWLEPVLVELAVIAAPTIAISLFFQRRSRPASTSSRPALDQRPVEATEPPARPERLRLMPEYHCAPLWDDVRGNNIDPGDLGLSPELLQRLHSWDALFQATFDEADPFASGFGDIAAEHAWAKQGNAIVQALAKEWPGPLSNQISALAMLVRDARQDLGPWDELPEDRLAAIGEKCGVAEIVAAIVWLDELSRETDALPEWDGDSQDDIARARAMLHGILARVPGRYIEIVASGLQSPEWHTRVHIAMALAGHDRARALPILRDALTREEDETARQLIAIILADAESEGQ